MDGMKGKSALKGVKQAKRGDFIPSGLGCIGGDSQHLENLETINVNGGMTTSTFDSMWH